MKTKLSFLLMLCLIALVGFSQQPQQQIWYLNNQSIDFRVFPPVLNAGLPGSPGAGINESRNGVHNQNGNLLFYVEGNHVINKLGNNVGSISTFSFPQSELAIVPVPGSGCQYYIINQYVSQFSNPCTGMGDRWNLTYSTMDVTLNSNAGGLINSNIQLESCTYNTGSAIAIGKPKINNTQLMYEVGITNNSFNILKYTISPSGISAPTTIFSNSFTYSSLSPAEMDLSFNEDKLVFTNGSNEICIIHLDASGNLNTALGNQTGGFTKYTISGQPLTGVEFSTSGNNLFVGQRNTGILVVNPSNGSYSLPLSNSTNYGNSQLETAYDPSGNNEIYVTDGSDFGKIANPNTSPSFSSGVLSGYNPMQDLNNGVYQLPIR